MSDKEREAIIDALYAIASALSFCESDMQIVVADRIDAIHAAIDKLEGMSA